MKSCGKLANDIYAKLAFIREKERRERLGRQRVSITSLQANYGFNWPLIAHVLSSLEILIHVRKHEHIKSTHDLNRYLTAQEIEMSRDLPMTVSHINANRTSYSETTQANTTELIPSNITENLGMADGRFRRNLPSNKTESTAISTDLSNKSKNKPSASETISQIPGISETANVTSTLTPKKQTSTNPPVLSPSATPSKQCRVETVDRTPMRSPVPSLKSPVRPCSVVVEDLASPSLSPSKQGSVEITSTSPLKSPFQIAKFQSLNTPVPKTKNVAGKRKRKKVNYVDSDEELRSMMTMSAIKRTLSGKIRGLMMRWTMIKEAMIPCFMLNRL